MPLTEKLLWTIETGLTTQLSLAGLAGEFGLTPHHVSRVFADAAGMSVMTYIRRRRLSQAAIQLQAGHADILQLALSCGYGSHEAFTRAFRACFRMSPSELRRNPLAYVLPLTEELQMKREMLVPLAAPDIRRSPGMSVVGIMLENSAQGGSIPALWAEFNARRPNPQDTLSFGVCLPGRTPGSFGYLAGMRSTIVPQGMSRVSLAAGRYAVFTHDGHISDLSKTAYTAWNQALPELCLVPRAAPDFELYDQRFNPETGMGQVELWIPLADEAA